MAETVARLRPVTGTDLDGDVPTGDRELGGGDHFPVLLGVTGKTAVAFSFLGMPAIGAGIGCYLLSLRAESKEST